MDEISLKDATDYLIDELIQEFKISKAKARKLLANALLYNVVINEIKDQADYIPHQED